eukprot:1759476-Rhodomonas_salina.1
MDFEVIFADQEAMHKFERFHCAKEIEVVLGVLVRLEEARPRGQRPTGRRPNHLLRVVEQTRPEEVGSWGEGMQASPTADNRGWGGGGWTNPNERTGGGGSFPVTPRHPLGGGGGRGRGWSGPPDGASCRGAGSGRGQSVVPPQQYMPRQVPGDVGRKREAGSNATPPAKRLDLPRTDHLTVEMVSTMMLQVLDEVLAGNTFGPIPIKEDTATTVSGN